MKTVSKTLPTKFIGIGDVKGFEFKCVYRSPTHAIYEVLSGKGIKPYYEVFMLKYAAICVDFKNNIYSDSKLKEVYPKSKDFGAWAWTTPTLEKAMKKINL